MKNFNEFIKIIYSHHDEIISDSERAVNESFENDVLNTHKLIINMSVNNLKTTIKLLKEYHEWLHSTDS